MLNRYKPKKPEQAIRTLLAQRSWAVLDEEDQTPVGEKKTADHFLNNWLKKIGNNKRRWVKFTDGGDCITLEGDEYRLAAHELNQILKLSVNRGSNSIFSELPCHTVIG